jgi:hypothetical protein
MDLGKFRVVFYLMAFVSMISMLQAQGTGTSTITSQLCSIVDSVRTIVGVLALTLFLIGGVLYAVSHFLPTNLDFKKSLTVWSQGMIIGGLIGLVIVLIAQPIIQLVLNIGGSVGGGGVTAPTC